MKKLTSYILLLLAPLALTGCWLDDDDDKDVVTVTVFHTSAEAPAVNVRLGDEVVVTNADFKQSASTRVSGTRNLFVDARLPDGQTLEVLGPATIMADAENVDAYDVFAIGQVGNATLEALVISDDLERMDADSVRLRVAHLASAAPAVDVYVTAPDADLAAASPTLTFSYKTVTDALEVPAGDYRVRVTAAGQSDVLFDSGTVPLASGADLLIAAVDNTNHGDAPISLLVESEGTTTELVDADAGAGLRAVHNAYDAPAVDIYLGGITGAPAIAGLSFPDAAPGAALGNYASVAAGTTDVAITATGDSNAVVQGSFELGNGMAYTVLAANALADIELLPFTDDARSVATEARLRVIHGAGQAPNVDVYLTAQGSGGIGNASPVLSDVPFGASSGFLAVAEGDYDVYVTVAGTGTVAIGPIPVTLSNGGVYTAIAREASDFGSSGSFTVTGLDDLASPSAP